MGRALHFPQDGWERTARDWSAWWQGELERPLVVLECIERSDAYDPHCASTFLTGEPLDRPADELLEQFELRLANTHFLGDSFPRFWPNFGPGITAAFLGARLEPAWDTTWFSPSQELPLSERRVAFDPGHPWWARVRELTAAALARWRGELAVGFTDLGGNLDILAALHGTQKLLVDMVDQPDELDRLVGETSRVWLTVFQELAAMLAGGERGFTCWGPLWSPGPGYMLQSDFSAMISPAMFARFVLPDLERCSAAMEYAFYHLDGPGAVRHLDALLSVPDLRGIQWVPGDGRPPAERWLDLLGRIRRAGRLCQVTVSPAGALTIQRELGGRGFCFLISEPQLTPAEGQSFLRELGR